MTKIENFYRLTYKRKNYLKELLLSMIYSFASLPSLVVETILRKNLGERRFSLSGAVISLLIMAFIPILVDDDIRIVFKGGFRMYGRHFDAGEFFLSYTTWYIFLVGYLFMLIKRYEEIIIRPSVFEMKRFTLAPGDIHPFFYSFQLFGKKCNVRVIETVLEPLVFFIPGLFLSLIGQPLGYLFIALSIFYSFSIQLLFYAAEKQLMDTIDIQICGEEFSNLLDGVPSSQTQGARLYSRPITNPETKRQIVETFTTEDTATEID